MHTAVHIAIQLRVIFDNSINDLLRLLRSSPIIQVYQGLIVYRTRKNREILPDMIDIKGFQNYWLFHTTNVQVFFVICNGRRPPATGEPNTDKPMTTAASRSAAHTSALQSLMRNSTAVY